MRLKDAIASLQLGRKKEAEIRECLMQGQIFHPTG